MMSRWLSFVGMLALVGLPASVRSAEAETGRAPTVIVRISSISAVLNDVKYLAKLAGQEDKANEAAGFLESMTDEKGLGGIDLKRPLGVYANISEDLLSSGGVVLVPVADQKALLDFLERFNIKAEKGDHDVYTITSGTTPIPVPIYARFANHYAYVTVLNDTALTKDKLLDPKVVLDSDRTALASVRFRLNQVPENLKRLALGNVERHLADEQEKQVPNETPTVHELRGQTLKSIASHFSALINEGGDLGIYINVDRKANELVAELDLAGKKDSKLSAGIADLREAQSVFGGLADKDAAVNLLLHATLPESLRKAFTKALHEGAQKAENEVPVEAMREAVKKLFKALEPTVRAGELDTALILRGPTEDKHYSFVAGLKVRDGLAVDKALQDLARFVPDKDREKIKMNAETVDGVAVHRLEVQKDYDEDTRRMLGDNPLFVALRADAVLVAGGANGLDALKQALAAPAAASPQVRLDISLAHLIPLMAKGNEQVLEKLRKIADATFKDDPKADRIRVTVEGGDALKARATLSGSAFAFLAQMGQDPTLHGGAKASPKKKERKKKIDD